MTGIETANFELPLITKHGIRMEVLLNATSRRDEQGNIIGVVGIGQDITGSYFFRIVRGMFSLEYKTFIHRFSIGLGRIAQEREYSKLIDTANAPIFGVDTLGRVNVWNQVLNSI